MMGKTGDSRKLEGFQLEIRDRFNGGGTERQGKMFKICGGCNEGIKKRRERDIDEGEGLQRRVIKGVEVSRRETMARNGQRRDGGRQSLERARGNSGGPIDIHRIDGSPEMRFEGDEVEKVGEGFLVGGGDRGCEICAGRIRVEEMDENLLDYLRRQREKRGLRKGRHGGERGALLLLRDHCGRGMRTARRREKRLRLVLETRVLVWRLSIVEVVDCRGCALATSSEWIGSRAACAVTAES